MERTDKSTAEFCPKRKDRNGARFQGMFVFLLLFCLILRKSTKNYSLRTHSNKIFFSLSLDVFKSNKLVLLGPNFFLSGRTFSPDWLESSAKSWQHCMNDVHSYTLDSTTYVHSLMVSGGPYKSISF